MMKLRVPATVVLLCLLACATGVAVAADSKKKKSRPPSFEDAAYWAERWEGEERDAWQRPMVLVDMLAVQAGEVVVDLGAGTGYFTRLLAVLVGDEGKVYAVDVERSMLSHILAREDIARERVATIVAEPDDPKLPDGEIDLVLTVNTWHHIEKREAYIERLGRCLTRGGRVVIVDFRDEELPVGPPPKHKLSRAQVVKEFEKAGWRLAAESVAFPYQYCLTFLPPAGPGELELFSGEPAD
jgi:ubiquinone/menaquinone biosynthesis C-methylase UbiE